MAKDFQKWHELKAEIDSERELPLFREGEIWWCSLGANVGVEEDGKNDSFERPVLVFRKFNANMLWGLPMTSRAIRMQYDCAVSFHGQSRTVLISQMRILSAKRLLRRVGKLDPEEFLTLARYMSVFFEIKTDPLRDPRVPGIHPEAHDEPINPEL
jgi:mRNA interferase MazF